MAIISDSFDSADNGHGITLTDANGATVAGAAVAATTLGGCVAVGVTVLPGQVAFGALSTAALLGIGAVKNETGSYLPSLRNVDPEVDEAMTKKEAKASKKSSKKTEAVASDDDVIED